MPKILVIPPKLLKKKNYQAMIFNLIRGQEGTFIFRNLFAKLDNGTEVDLLDSGRLSCAVTVSGILLLNGLIGGMHATVDSTEKDMLKNGWAELEPGKDWLNTPWQEIKPLLKNKIGAVIVWEKQTDKKGIEYSHIGFYADDDFAISNDSATHRVPMKHHITFGLPGHTGFRRIEKIYWHSELDAD